MIRMTPTHIFPWYKKIEDFLMPFQFIVIILLLAIIAISIWALFQDPVKRTAWVVYMWLP